MPNENRATKQVCKIAACCRARIRTASADYKSLAIQDGARVGDNANTQPITDDGPRMILAPLETRERVDIAKWHACQLFAIVSRWRWRGGRVVEGTSLENWQRRKAFVGSNPTLSAIPI